MEDRPLLVMRTNPVIRKGRLKFTIGIARSGKSTYATRWSQYLEDWKTGDEVFPRVIVCSDDIRLAVHGERFNKDAEPAVWMINTYMTKSMLSRGHDVIIDGTNTTEDSIFRILSIDPHATYVLFDTPPDVCETRALANGHIDLVEHGVIRRQSGQLEQLKAEGLDNVVERIRQRVLKRWSA